MGWMISLIILLPLLTGGANILLFKQQSKIGKILMVTSLGALILINYLMARTQIGVELRSIQILGPIRIAFRVDGMSSIFSILASSLWLMTALYSFDYMAGEARERAFNGYFMLVLSPVLGIAYSANLLTLFIFYELLTLTTFPLIIFRGSDEALSLGNKYLLYSFIGSSLIIAGMSLYFFQTGQLDFLPQLSFDSDVLVMSYVFMFIGFGVKTALVPFHSWLPSAMIAPTPVSALLHAVAVVKSGIFSLIRVTYYLFGYRFLTAHATLQSSLLTLITVSVLVGAFLAYHQSNLKKRLAYSTISQLGYILMGIVLSNEYALTGAILHLINHAIIKISLFFAVGMMYKRAHITEFEEVDGLGKKMPLLLGVFTWSTISIMGLPPSNGFVSKWFLAMGIIEQNRTLFVSVLLISAFMTAIYLLPVGINAFFKPEKQVIVAEKLSLKVSAILVILTIANVYLGLLPNGLIRFIHQQITEKIF